jgi:hypothetical protein
MTRGLELWHGQDGFYFDVLYCEGREYILQG